MQKIIGAPFYMEYCEKCKIIMNAPNTAKCSVCKTKLVLEKVVWQKNPLIGKILVLYVSN